METRKIIIVLLLVAIFFSIISISLSIIVEKYNLPKNDNFVNQGKIQIIVEKELKNGSR